MLTLVLASGSPRRTELLRSLGLQFQVRPVDLDETPETGESPEEYVERLAREKSEAQAEPGEVLLAADTIVVVDGELLGKPTDRRASRAMLERLAGRWHRVLTGVALHRPDTGRTDIDVAISRVRIAELTADEIDWYVETGETDDKAGAYAIQGLGALFVEAVEGNYTNVVGLPLPSTYRLFERQGLDLRTFRE